MLSLLANLAQCAFKAGAWVRGLSARCPSASSHQL